MINLFYIEYFHRVLDDFEHLLFRNQLLVTILIIIIKI
jgi:hypothetical protein